MPFDKQDRIQAQQKELIRILRELKDHVYDLGSVQHMERLLDGLIEWAEGKRRLKGILE